MNDSSNSSSRRPRKSRGKVVAIAVVALGLIGYGTYTFFGGGNNEDEYFFDTVRVGNIEDLVTATGTLQPRDYVDVGAQVSGQIQKIYVNVGDVVAKGDLLAEIDAETSIARVEVNEAQLASSKNNLENQRTNLEKAKRDYERQKNLFAEDATTREQLLNAETTLLNAERSVISSELTIQQQEANMRIEKKNLAYTTITAPIDGTVMSIAVREGQTINASQSAPTVLRLADLGTMEVLADVSEADVSKISAGMNVYFNTLGAGQNRRYYGQVKRREPTPKTQQGVVLYPVLFDVDNQDGSLMPNMTAQVFFVAAEARNVLTVPMSALQQGQQIAREMAAREGGGEGPGGGMPNMMASTEGAPAGAAAGAAGGSAPATASDAPAGGAGGPGAAGFGGGGRPQGGPPGGMRGGFNGGQPPTPEQIEEFRRNGGGGGFGGRGGGMGMAAGGGGRQQQRRGTVMVKLADGSLEPRQVVIGVTDRVTGQVLEGLEEGEEVVIGRRDQEVEMATSPTTTQPQNNNFRGGGGFGGGGFRPF